MRIAAIIAALLIASTSVKAMEREEAEGYFALFVVGNMIGSVTSFVRAEKMEDRIQRQRENGLSVQSNLRTKSRDLYNTGAICAVLSIWGIAIQPRVINAYFGKDRAGVRYTKRF